MLADGLNPLDHQRVESFFGTPMRSMSQQGCHPQETCLHYQVTPGSRLVPGGNYCANEVDLPDATLVIGITTDKNHRAYRVAAIHPIFAHVVNDLIGDIPVTVTYCDRTDCTQVFTDESLGAPLMIDLGGYLNKMLLKVGSRYYFQETGASINNQLKAGIPYSTHPIQKTTWKEWKDAHPTTDIYVGPAEAKPAPKVKS